MLSIGAGCNPKDCVEDRDIINYVAGDRCPLLIDGGDMKFYPATVELPPMLSAADAPGGVAIVPAERLTIRGWSDRAMSVPAAGYLVELYLAPCDNPDDAADIPLSGHLEPIEVAADIQPCEYSSEYLMSCSLDHAGQADVRVLSGPMLTSGSDDLCVWAQSGARMINEDKKDPKYDLTRSSAAIKVRYNVDDIDLAIVPVLASPLSCGAAETPCKPTRQPLPSAALCSVGDACGAIQQAIRFAVVTQYHGFSQAVGEDIEVALTLASDDGAGHRWISDSERCLDDPDNPLSRTTIVGATGRSPDLWLCSDGLGGTTRMQVQAPTTPGLSATSHARFAAVLARVSDLVLLSGGDDDVNASFRVRVTSCDGAGLAGVTLTASLDDQPIGPASVSDALGEGMLTVPKPPGQVDGNLLVRIEDWQSTCSFAVP